MEVEIVHTPIPLPGLIAEEIQLQKHLKENDLSNPASKMPTTTESGGQGPNTAHDPKVEKGLPKIYQKESKLKSDQLKHTKRSQLVKAKRTSL